MRKMFVGLSSCALLGLALALPASAAPLDLGPVTYTSGGYRATFEIFSAADCTLCAISQDGTSLGVTLSGAPIVPDPVTGNGDLTLTVRISDVQNATTNAPVDIIGAIFKLTGTLGTNGTPNTTPTGPNGETVFLDITNSPQTMIFTASTDTSVIPFDSQADLLSDTGTITSYSVDLLLASTAVPEPGSMSLVLAGLTGLVVRSRSRRRN
jgi:hypothetical protein